MILIPAATAPPAAVGFRPQIPLSPQSGGCFRYNQRRAEIRFDRNGSPETVSLNVVEIDGLAWAIICSCEQVIAAHLIIGHARPDASTEYARSPTRNAPAMSERWLGGLFRAMGLPSVVNHYFDTSRSGAIQIPVADGQCHLELFLRRISTETATTPQSGSTCSFLLLLVSDEQTSLAHIL